ncbi:MAG: hypothetical protein P0116_15510 [Candidatus Nitrosocosmicus sp.]|nr:hypothetical protein [Candidatus Nitrosocosmicus sp.]
MINPKVELDRVRLRLRVDAFVRREEDRREEFEEFVPDKVMEVFSLVEFTVENAGCNDPSIKTIESVRHEIMLYFIPAKLHKKCIKKIHRL